MPGKTLGKRKDPHARDKAVRSALQKAQRSLDQERPYDALALCGKLLSGDASNLPALEICARAYWRIAAFEPALDTISRLLRLNPYEPGYHYLRGVCLQSLGRYGDAVRAFERAAEGKETSEAARQMIRELEEWQETLIAELLRDDKVFRMQYRHNPIQACLKMGFAFSGKVSKTHPMTEQRDVRIWVRPS